MYNDTSPYGEWSLLQQTLFRPNELLEMTILSQKTGFSNRVKI